MTHDLRVFDALAPKFTPFKFVVRGIDSVNWLVRGVVFLLSKMLYYASA